MIGGTFTITVVGSNIDLSFVGKADVKITGRGTDDDGTFSVNGGPEQAVPFLLTRFQLTAATGQNGG